LYFDPTANWEIVVYQYSATLFSPAVL